MQHKYATSNVPYFHEKSIKLPVYTYDRHVESELIISDIKQILQKLTKIKKTPRSLINLCIFSLVKNGMNINKYQVPQEILHRIKNFKNKHQTLFPTSMYYESQDNWVVRSYLPVHGNVYTRYAIYGTDRIFYLPHELDDKINFYSSTYIPRGSYHNLHLRRCSHIDLPMLNYHIARHSHLFPEPS